ncbi:cyclin domain protein, partial [Oesophagostomum dentatum]
LFSVVKGQADREKHKISLESEAADTNSCEADDGGTIDYHGIGLFCPLDLESEHRDFLVDIVNYGFSKQISLALFSMGAQRPCGSTTAQVSGHIPSHDVEIFYSDRLPTEVLPLTAYLVAVTASKRTLRRDQLENLCIAAMRLATKIESQYLLSEEILADFDLKKLNRMEREICEATEFRLLQCGAIFFMRIIQKLVERHSWQWKFAKFASQLAYCQMELAMLKPALLAGVVMRLCCLLVGDNEWPQECYEVLGEPIEDYDEPHAILCRLILTARVDDVFAEVYVHWHYVVERGLSIRPGWIEEQSKAANHVKMVGDRIFKE